MKLRDSGGFGAKYGPGTQDAQRPDGQWVRVFFDLPISFRRAQRFADAISAGKPIPPNARVRIVEVPPPYKFPGTDVNSWACGSPGELTPGERFEAKVALPDGQITSATYRESWLGEWYWYDAMGRKIKPVRYVYLPPPSRG